LKISPRSYFPGRSGQTCVVPREGDIITDRNPLYRFMHGSPWDYDTRIPILFHGAPFIRKGQWSDAVSQQDIAATLGAPHCARTRGAVLGAARPAAFSGPVLSALLARTASRPRIIALFVLDAMRADY